jgi:hypothetical protein
MDDFTPAARRTPKILYRNSGGRSDQTACRQHRFQYRESYWGADGVFLRDPNSAHPLPGASLGPLGFWKRCDVTQSGPLKSQNPSKMFLAHPGFLISDRAALLEGGNQQTELSKEKKTKLMENSFPLSPPLT